MKNFGIKEAGVRKVRAIFFLRFDAVGACGEKKQNLAQKKL